MPLAELSRKICGDFINAADTPEGLKLKMMLDKVDEMRRQRYRLTETLREGLERDDITKRALAERELDPGKLFETELKKHQPTVMLIEQNMMAQDKILEALTGSNANFAELRHRIVSANEKKTVVGGCNLWERQLSNGTCSGIPDAGYCIPSLYGDCGQDGPGAELL